MGLIRKIIGTLILTFDRLFVPHSIERTKEAQEALDTLTSQMKLYQFEACPFCVKVRRQIKRLGLKIELRDARKNADYGKELQEKGGVLQVPCLRIEKADGTIQWMYESSDINNYLITLTK